MSLIPIDGNIIIARRNLARKIERNKLLTEIQVSQMTGRSRSALQKDRFFRQGIPFVKIGRSVRYYLDDVVDFIDQCRVDTHAL